jgi:hypothetical protein
MKIFIFLTLIFVGCKNMQVPNGTYKVDQLDNCFITINNNRFKYYCNHHMSYCISEGYYELNKNKIYLFSDKEFNYGIISITQSININLKKGIIKVKVEDLDGYPYFATIKIKKADKVFYYETDKDGFINFDNKLITGKILLLSIGLKNDSGELLNLDKKNNDFVIKIKPHNYEDCFFEKKTFITQKNTLLDLLTNHKYKLVNYHNSQLSED